jgi:putative restriction endonuclease
MKLYVALTDYDWYTFLKDRSHLDEVNFWRPNPKGFGALNPGEPFLFKLHSPRNFIVGGGFFAHSSILPSSLAWQAFGEKNGAPTLEEKRIRIEKYRKVVPSVEDYNIGCILLSQPFFFNENQWIDVPADWKKSIQVGKTYDLAADIGKNLWDEVLLRIQGGRDIDKSVLAAEPTERYGSETTYRPRLGQGSFRIVVTDAYQRRCAVTQERVLPALEAAHIKPYAESGPHEIGNGVLLRSDLHHLLDAGYVTISTDYHFEVSKFIKEDFDNGEEYRQLHGSQLYLPAKSTDCPSAEFVKWHNEHKYKG